MRDFFAIDEIIIDEIVDNMNNEREIELTDIEQGDHIFNVKVSVTYEYEAFHQPDGDVDLYATGIESWKLLSATARDIETGEETEIAQDYINDFNTMI